MQYVAFLRAPYQISTPRERILTGATALVFTNLLAPDVFIAVQAGNPQVAITPGEFDCGCSPEP